MSEAIDIRKLMAERGIPDVPAPAPPVVSRFIDWDEFWAKDRTEAEWLFEDVLARGRGHSVYAKHGTGKSLFLLWVCMEMVKASHVVIYADWEMGEDDLYERLTDMGYGPETDLSRLRYLMIPELAPLNTDEGARQMGTIVDEVMLTWPDRNVAVVIDTISRAVEGEENSNDTIQGFYRHTGLELKRRAVTWVRLDHAGHEGTHARGASAKGDDVDVVWKLALTDDGIELKNEKRRMGWVPERVMFKMSDNPVLRYEKATGSWPAGTHDVARALDALDVPLEAGMRVAKKALAGAGNGRRGTVVEAAQRYRRSVQKAREDGRENLPKAHTGDTPGDTGRRLNDEDGRRSGDGEQKPLVHGRETPPETLGDASVSDEVPGGPPRRGAPGPAWPASEDDHDDPFPRGPLNGGSA